MSTPFPSPTKTWHTKAYEEINPKRPELSLAGKSALVTGAGGSIGAAIARAFAQAGVKHLALVGRRIDPLNAVKEEIEKSYGTQALVFSADITDKNSIDKAVASFRAHVGKSLDILVSNAGFLGNPSTIAEANAEEWWQPFTTNVLGSFLTIQAFIPVTTSNATIINITSAIAHIAPFPNVSAYAASKAATARVVEYLQSENPDLRIFNLHPGVVASDMNRDSGIPAMDQDDLPAAFSTWLCSDEVSFLKGRLVWTNWDVGELKAEKDKTEQTLLFTITLDGWPFSKSE